MTIYQLYPDRLPGRRLDAALRRCVDMALSLIGLIIAAPLMLLIVVAIRLDSPGPSLFRQVRLGQRGRQFRLYKFRKFVDGPGATGPAVTLKNDPRMTRVGRMLERSKLDELPQLWNILIGDMSLVGPRPETLDFAECFIGRFKTVLEFRPGLFGPSQAMFRNECTLYPAERDPHEFYRSVLFPSKAAIDLEYFDQRTFLSDFLWVFRGVLAVIGLGTVPLAIIDDKAHVELRAADSDAAD
jgi:lipopolysaccharide/colanic/teichoic acid biosynthesis glycosyltransferase